MNYFKCCLKCVPPKRYPGCSIKCEEYIKEKDRYNFDKKKARVGSISDKYFMERRIKSLERHIKYKKKRGHKIFNYGDTKK